MDRRTFLKGLGAVGIMAPTTYYFDMGANLWRRPEPNFVTIDMTGLAGYDCIALYDEDNTLLYHSRVCGDAHSAQVVYEKETNIIVRTRKSKDSEGSPLIYTSFHDDEYTIG